MRDIRSGYIRLHHDQGSEMRWQLYYAKFSLYKALQAYEELMRQNAGRLKGIREHLEQNAKESEIKIRARPASIEIKGPWRVINDLIEKGLIIQDPDEVADSLMFPDQQVGDERMV